jgi:uncharacterized protein (DUF1015 family)
MVEIRPFKALRPRAESISAVNSPPYDVVSRKEAVEIIKRNPDSFLKVVKPEATISSVKKPAYHKLAERSAEILRDMIDRKVMIVESERCLYVYQQNDGYYQRTGIVACLSTEDFQNGVIKQHERIRVKTWQERIQHIRINRAHTGCALMIYRSNSYIEELVHQAMETKNMIYDFISDDKVRNCCWKIKQKEMILSLLNAFQKVNSLYIADGHHRVAAAAEVAKIESRKQKAIKGLDNEYTYFPAVLIPHHQIRVLGYHRLVKDLQEFSSNYFLYKLEKRFEIARFIANKPFLPSKKHEFGMNLAGQWYKLFVKDNKMKESQNIIDQLDVSILQNQVLDPLLNIKDPQKSKKIEFIGGKDALSRITSKIRQGARIAFTLYPILVDEVIKVSDNREIMPPKSTWFEPKLRSGIFVHLFE